MAKTFVKIAATEVAGKWLFMKLGVFLVNYTYEHLHSIL